VHLSVSARKKYPSKLLASARAPRCLCKKKAPVQTPRLCASARNLVSSKLRAFASQRVHLGAFARNKITLCKKKNHPSKLRASAPLREKKHPSKLHASARAPRCLCEKQYTRLNFALAILRLCACTQVSLREISLPTKLSAIARTTTLNLKSFD
jgi:hypothetical protein